MTWVGCDHDTVAKVESLRKKVLSSSINLQSGCPDKGTDL